MMKKHTVFIIDDERLAREELKMLLQAIEMVELIGEASSGEEAKRLLPSLEPDILLVDINMPGMNGIEFVKGLNNPPYVIFVSAHEDHAISAFSVGAFDYLLKPINPNRLMESFNRILQDEQDDWDSAKEQPLEKKKLTITDKVYIRDGEKSWFVPLTDIRLFESDGNYVKVHFHQNKPMLLRSLNSFQELLDPHFFFRANRKHIVNIEWISSVETWFNGGLMVELKTGEKIEISRRQAIRFKENWGI
jgi:two-component system LytT family response regulator